MNLNNLNLIIYISIGISMFLMLIGAMFSKETFDRIMCINCFASYAIIFIAILASIVKQYYFLDIAIIYGLLNFIATIGYLKFYKYKKL